MATGTGTPWISVGVNCHCLTASTAAASSIGIDRSTFASFTCPSGPMIVSTTTTPCTCADCAAYRRLLRRGGGGREQNERDNGGEPSHSASWPAGALYAAQRGS